MGAQREESALNMFRQMDLRGKAQNDTQLKTVHQNTISTLREFAGAGGTLQKFSSMLALQRPSFTSLIVFSKWSRWPCSDLVYVKIIRDSVIVAETIDNRILEPFQNNIARCLRLSPSGWNI